MKKGISFLLGLLFLCTVQLAMAQLDGGAFNSTGSGQTAVSLADYQSLGVNPANLGWKKDDHKMHIGFFEFGISIYSEPLSKQLVFSDLIGNSPDFSSQAQRDEAVKNFTDTELWIQINTTLFGFSYQDEKVGGIAFSVKQRLFWNSVLNESASEFMFEGYNSPYFDSISVEQPGDTIGWSTDPENASYLYNPTDISHLLFFEYALGYGRKLVDNENFKFYAGIDFKLLQGFGIMNYNSITPTSVDGYQALSNAYGVKYNEPTPSALTGDGWQTAGMGFGIDIGVSFEIYKNTRVAVAMNDIGSIKWDGNVYEGDNVPIKNIETAGIDNYNIFSESGGIIADNTNLGKWVGVADKTVSLPMNLRVGASHKPIETLSFGAEAYIPLSSEEIPGRYIESIYAAGVSYLPAKWFQLNAGFNFGGGYGFTMPVGFTFRPVSNANTMWEMGFSSRDMITWFRTDHPLVSIVFGFMRIGF